NSDSLIRISFDYHEDIRRQLPIVWEGLEKAEYSPSSQPILLGDRSGIARAINSQREIVGDVAHKAIYWHNKKLRYLCKDSSEATGINQAGEVIYSSGTTGMFGHLNSYHAFRWKKGKQTELKSLGGKFIACNAINDSGFVVGYSSTVAGEDHACLW